MGCVCFNFDKCLFVDNPLPFHSLFHLFILLVLRPLSYICWFWCVFWNGIRWEATLLVFFLHIFSLILLLWPARRNLHNGQLSLAFPVLSQRAGRVPEQIWSRKRGEANSTDLLLILHAVLSFPQGIRVFPRHDDKRQKIGALWWSLFYFF